MLRSLRLVAGAGLVLFAGAALAQAPNTDLFPLKAKTKWVYKGTDHEVTVVVAGTEKLGDKECTKVETLVNGQTKATELYYVTADGVYRAKVKDEKIDPPVKLLALPAKKDATWKVDSKVGNDPNRAQVVKGEFKIKDEKEKVKTPAGEFDCVAVEGVDMDIAGTKTTVRQWFAPGKGLVKIGFVIQGTESALELKEFSEGK